MCPIVERYPKPLEPVDRQELLDAARRGDLGEIRRLHDTSLILAFHAAAAVALAAGHEQRDIVVYLLAKGCPLPASSTKYFEREGIPLEPGVYEYIQLVHQGMQQGAFEGLLDWAHAASPHDS